MSIEAINALHQRIKDLAASSTPDQLAYLAKALESIIDKKATFSVEQMTEVKEVIDALQKRVKDLAANSTPDQLAYLAKALESIVDKSSVSEIVQMTDEKLKELLSAARSHLDEINSNKENSISAITAAKTESVDEINTLRTNSLAALKESSNSHISLLNTRKNANIAAINSVSNTHKEGLKSLVEDFRAVNNVPPGSSIIREIETRDNQLKTSIINEVKTRDDQLKTSLTNDVRTRDDQLKAYLINEIRKRNMIESGSLPFLFGILSRYNEGHWSNDDNGYFKAELGKWYKDTTQTDYMLQLLAGSNTYDCTYSGFYRPPQLYFLQGNNGKFLYREEFMRRNHLADQKNYPYALLGVIFVKNTTNSNKSRTLYFSGSSHWSSGYEGAGLFVGVPSHVNTSKSATSGITWTNVYNYSSSSAAFSSSNNITVPANKTVAILFYTSPFYQTPGSNYYVWFMRWSIYSFRSSFLTTGLEVDVERTLKAWQCPGLSNTYEIWR